MFRSPRDLLQTSPTPVIVYKRHNEPEEINKRTNCKCEFCELEWESETEVEIHKYSLHKNRIYNIIAKRDRKPACLYCATQHSKENLIKHIQSKHFFSSPTAQRIEREVFICDLCQQLFFNKLMLSFHLSFKHKFYDHSTKHPCPKCLRMIRLDSMWAHCKLHQMHSASCCHICFVKCRNKTDLEAHINTHPKHLYCDPCNFKASNPSQFKSHLNEHKILNDKLKCDAKKFFVPRDIKKWRYSHFKSFKGLELTLSDQVYVCVFCRELCTNTADMERHVPQHNMLPDPVDARKQYICTCGESFSNHILLKKHVFELKANHEAVVSR